MAQHNLGVEYGMWQAGERAAWVPFSFGPHTHPMDTVWGWEGRTRKGKSRERVECDAKVAPAERTFPHPWKWGGWSRGIASWGRDSSLGSSLAHSVT